MSCNAFSLKFYNKYMLRNDAEIVRNIQVIELIRAVEEQMLNLTETRALKTLIKFYPKKTSLICENTISIFKAGLIRCELSKTEIIF